MTHGEKVVFAFFVIGISRDDVVIVGIEKSLGSAGENFVYITLMRYVIHDFIMGRVEYIVQGNGCFYHTEVGAYVPAVYA